MVVAARGVPEGRVFLLIVLAMVFARTAAMTFNRLADWSIDQRNPRTEGRHRLMSRRGACVLLAVSTLAFLGVTAAINSLCLWLSPLALGIGGIRWGGFRRGLGHGDRDSKSEYDRMNFSTEPKLSNVAPQKHREHVWEK